MKNLILTLAIASVISLVACQKDYTPEASTSDSTIIIKDSIYLDSLILTYVDVIPEIYVHKFYYDNKKRVSHIVETGINYYGIDSFYYNSADTLPYLRVTKYIDGDNYSDSIHLRYDNTGRKIYDSTLHFNATLGFRVDVYVTKFDYNGISMLFRNLLSVQQGISSSIQRDTCILDAKGNVISAKLYDVFNMTSKSYQISYDNKSSPLHKMNIKTALYELPYQSGSLLYYSFNNVLSINSTSPERVSTIAYNNFSLPIYNKTVFTFSGGNEETQTIYKYKNL